VTADLALSAWAPGDSTMDGYVPLIGAHVVCIRDRDDQTRCGVVDENRCGLFLTGCDGRRVVLTAALWWVRATLDCAGGDAA
jgi:hypothetical protein